MCFKKRNKSKLIAQDRELIELNANAVDTLIVLAGENEEIIGALKDIQNKLRYLIASDNTKVYKLDEIIKNQLQDMKLYLNKPKKVEIEGVKDYIREIEVSIVSRNNLI